MHFLYILRSKVDHNLYIGIAEDVEKRIAQHNAGRVRSTKSRRPLQLVYQQSFPTRQEAAKQEWLLKHTPGAGKQKQRLVENYRQSMRR
ncbi:MAG: GIY-YIG nuclease family protein [Candidatus Kerfeldbacteria bacterium]|nr:GIY-YIG nuclease family protein [Candidatus Kerfeldbacteria bacterium]